MTEHHGLDLAAIQKRMGSHSIFGPSSSAMWLYCSGSLIPNLMAEDDANEDAAYGTVGHEVAEIWLNRMKAAERSATFQSLIRYYRPTELVGTVRTITEGSGRTFEIEIDDEMLAHVETYIEWCLKELGKHNGRRWESDIYIEQRVDLSRLMPLPRQGGTADFAACRWQLLKVKDLKMGKGVRVFAERNTQALLYALGFFYEWDWLYNFQTIEIGIGQPRLDHWDTWEVTREELLQFAAWVPERARLAWTPGQPRTPGKKQCQWCKVKGDCAAAAKYADDSCDDQFDDLDDPDKVTVAYDGVIEGVKYSVVEQAAWAESLVSGAHVPFRGATIDPGELDTEALAKLLPYRSLVEKWFSAIAAELESRALAGEEIPGHKLATGRAGHRKWIEEKAGVQFLRSEGADSFDYMETKLISPARAIELLRTLGYKKKKAEELIDLLVIRPEGRTTLVAVSDERPALPPPAEVFDDLDAL